MSRRTIAGVDFDTCRGGCGGIWFDWHELTRVDEPDEAHGEMLLDSATSAVVDPDGRRDCPRCLRQPMQRNFRSVKRAVTVDTCPRCGGCWLDPGELRQLRAEYRSEDALRSDARACFADLFDDELATMRAASVDEQAQARRIAHALRFICPSYYLPGKQDGGAF